MKAPGQCGIRQGPPTPSSAPAQGLLTDCWLDFRRLGWPWHLLALAILVGLLAVQAAPVVWADSPTVDETTYERSFAAVADGRSPYQTPGYYYPAAFAYLGALFTRELGVGGARLLYRCLSLGGSALTCWLAAAWWWSASNSVRRRVTERLLVALVLMLAAPGVGAGLATGNFSLTASSWINTGLHFAHSWPLLAGAFLGASLVTKPLAAIAVPILAGAAFSPAPGRKVAPSTVGLAASIAVAGWVLVPHFGEMLALQIQDGALGGTISLLRVARLLELDFRPFLLLALLAPLALLAGRRFASDRVALICVSLAMVMFSSPAIWPYTATVFFPVPVMALSVARSRYSTRDRGPVPTGEARLELALVAALAIAVLFLNGGAFDLLPRATQLALLMGQLAAPLLLAGYVLRTTVAWQSGASGAPGTPSAEAGATDRLSV